MGHALIPVTDARDIGHIMIAPPRYQIKSAIAMPAYSSSSSSLSSMVCCAIPVYRIVSLARCPTLPEAAGNPGGLTIQIPLPTLRDPSTSLIFVLLQYANLL